jgi:hypothetical protein
MGLIAFFDFLSHPTMHLPFNEGYIRVLRAAFPDDEILVAAEAGHVANLRASCGGLAGVAFVAVAPHSVARSSKAHDPFAGRPAAERCWREVVRALDGRVPKLAVLGGMDANLLAVFRRRWRAFTGVPLHYVLHNHLDAAKAWRTRNPFLRRFDFLSVFGKALPPGQAIVALELGIAAAIEAEFPVHRGRVLTLEHPVLDNEWCAPASLPVDRPIRVGFTGHCARDKGFDFFVELADRFAGRDFEFHAIGRENAPELDTSRLSRKPAPGGLARPDFVAALHAMDFVCLPLSPDSTYVASGSVIDAFAAAKPLIIVANPMLRAIRDKYGAFGLLGRERAEILHFFEGFDRDRLAGQHAAWVETVTRIREARRPERLGTAYAASVSPEG